MKASAFLATLLLLLSLCRAGAATPLEKPPAMSAAEIVSQLDGILEEDDEGVMVLTPKEFAAIMKRKMERFDRLAADFRTRFAEHPLRWKVLLLEALHLPVREQAGLPMPAGKSAGGMFDAILAADDAAPQVKSEASYHRLMLGAERVGRKEFTVEDWEKQLAAHRRDFSGAEDVAELEELHLGLVEEFAPARVEALLAVLAAHQDSAISGMAKEKQVARKAMAELRSKPLDLKFKALDGSEVDLAKLRGKVVLVDFWATWCGPSMAAMPKLTAAYAKLHGQGFEIIGISLDEDEAALKRVLKSKKIPWAQHFDGRGWENEFARQFGITAIPATWLVNREGMIVEVNPEGNLTEKIEALLK